MLRRFTKQIINPKRIHTNHSLLLQSQGNDSQEGRRRKLLYHSRKRGRIETELFFGSYASENIWKMNEKELDLFESLLNEQDVDLYNWVLGKAPIPPEHQNELFEKILTYIHTEKNLTKFNDDYDSEEGYPIGQEK